ncbi:MAG: insulinase family protein, partial [Planctomycetes bacterium]|nr:insulinase family protein [Planctomycetota bacterium]
MRRDRLLLFAAAPVRQARRAESVLASVLIMAASFGVALVAASLAFAATPAFAAHPTAAGIFPYPITTERLDNGVTLLVVPFDSPGVASFYTLVRAGSRNEVEPGRTGYAHFFEHMMMRGTKAWPETKRRDLIVSTGSDDNGWATDDYTTYALTTQSARLPEIIAEEADRIRNLAYDEAAFQTESKAILGEYNKDVLDPEFKLDEVLRQTAFTVHPYQHNSMGFLEDIRKMPEGYNYSQSFFNRFYAPSNVVLIAVGDVDPKAVVALVREHYGSWKKPAIPPLVVPEPKQTAERRATVEWEVPTMPRVAIAYHTPAGAAVREMAALRLIGRALFGESSPLYRDLVLERKLAVKLSVHAEETRDPGIFKVTARVPKAEELPAVEQAIEQAIEGYTAASVPEAQLAPARLRLGYELLLSLPSAPRIAGTLAHWTSLTGDPGAIDAHFDAVANVSIEEIERTARAVFRAENRTVVTLVTTAAAAGAPAEARPPAAAPATSVPCALTSAPIEMPRPAEPTVAVRVAFRAGSIDDPPGMEGLTALAARAMAEGGTGPHSFQEINALLDPTAADLRVDADKEVTTFYGRVHRDHADLFVGLLMERLLDPRFDAADIERVRRVALDDIRSRLRNNDDENLGKEVLSSFLFAAHPYGPFAGGTVRALERMTAADLRAHRARVFTADRVTVGLAGGYSEDLKRKLLESAAKLPCLTGPAGGAMAAVADEGWGAAGSQTGAAAAAVGAGGANAAPSAAASSPMGLSPVLPPATLGATENRLILVEKPTDSTAISIGFALDVKRGDPDFPALAFAASWFGEHRQMSGWLQKRMRILRGLNYGNYAYTEFFRQDRGSVYPVAGFPRSRQYFSIWVRPVEPENGPFALRQAVHELRKLLKEGIPAGELERAR